MSYALLHFLIETHIQSFLFFSFKFSKRWLYSSLCWTSSKYTCWVSAAWPGDLAGTYIHIITVRGCMSLNFLWNFSDVWVPVLAAKTTHPQNRNGEDEFCFQTRRSFMMDNTPANSLLASGQTTTGRQCSRSVASWVESLTTAWAMALSSTAGSLPLL